MPAPTHPNAPSLSVEERKLLLVLACEADRAAWCCSCRPRPRPAAIQVARLLNYLEPLLSLIPGRPGRWLGRVGFIARAVRRFGLLAS